MSSISTLINFEEVKEISFFPIQFLTLSRPSRQDDWVFLQHFSPSPFFMHCELLLPISKVANTHLFNSQKDTNRPVFDFHQIHSEKMAIFFLSINKSKRTYRNVKRTHMYRTMFNSKIASVVIENLLSLIKILCRGLFE